MKWVILAFVVVLATAFGKRCDTNDECEEDECCVKYFATGKLAELSGLCQDLAYEDQKCNFPYKSGQPQKFFYDTCTCRKGLKCKYTQQFIYKGGITMTDPKCIVE